jgi:hypothetical protein
MLAAMAPANTVAVKTPIRASPLSPSTLSGSSKVSSGR